MTLRTLKRRAQARMKADTFARHWANRWWALKCDNDARIAAIIAAGAWPANLPQLKEGSQP